MCVFQLKDVIVMFIDDISDSSRNMSVEFWNCQRKDYKCQYWPKIQKLLLFCGHASVMRIDVDIDNVSEYSVIVFEYYYLIRIMLHFRVLWNGRILLIGLR